LFLTGKKHVNKFQKILHPAYQWLLQHYGLDLRSLALYRFCLGLMIMVIVIGHFPGIHMFFTDEGVYNRQDFFNVYGNYQQLCLYLANGSWLFVACLFVLTIVCALCLMLGFHTKKMSILCWFLLYSLQSRVPILNNGGDQLLINFMLISIWLPLGKRFSVDSALEQMHQNHVAPSNLNTSHSPAPNGVFNGASLAFFCQIIVFYVSAAYAKTSEEWNVDYNAVYYSLHLLSFSTPLGLALGEHAPPELLQSMTIGSLILEKYGSFLLISPFYSGFFRCLGLALFILFHMGLCLCLNLGLFAFVDILILFAFLPSYFWDTLLAKLPFIQSKFFPTHPITLIYKRESLRHGLVLHLFKTFFLPGNTSVLSVDENNPVTAQLQGNWGIQRDTQKTRAPQESSHSADSDLPVLEGVSHWKSLINASPWLSFLSGMADHPGFRNVFYGWFKWLKRTLLINTSPLTPPMFATKALFTNLCGLFLCFYMIQFALAVYRVDGTEEKENIWFPELGNTLKFYQYWKMFDSSRRLHDGWVVMPGQLAGQSAKNVDVLHGLFTGEIQPANERKPYSSYDAYPNDRFRQYFYNVSYTTDVPRDYGNLVRYICKVWNKKYQDTPSKQLHFLDIYYYFITIPAPGEPENPVNHYKYFSGQCY
jgi:hypothetical protein